MGNPVVGLASGWKTLRARGASGPALYLGLVAVLTVYFLARASIVAGDTDLWYHLAAGRYIVENGRLPVDSWFSFLEPPRPHTDYYWLFQVVVFAVERVAGYGGLILLRAVLMGGTLLVAAHLLLSNRSGSLALWASAAVLTLLLGILLGRLLVRPYQCSYLLVLALVSCRELAPGRVALPVLLGVLLANLHGVEYPVFLVVCGAYGAEWALRGGEQRSPRALAAILLPVFSLLASPHGWRLLPVPFRFTGGQNADAFVGELVRISPSDLLDFRAENLALSYSSSLSLYLAAVVVAAIALAVSSRRVRVAHLLMALGGAVLLWRSGRFAQECAILCLPLVRAGVSLLDGRNLGSLFVRRPAAAVCLLLSLAPAVLPFRMLQTALGDRPRFPFSPAGLPVGTVRFLELEGGGGRVLNTPNPGGYLEWRLAGDYRILIDMQNPFMFDDDDFFFSRAVAGDAAVLRKALDRYEPDFVLVELADLGFVRNCDRLEDYAPVVFDDATILYASRTTKADVIARHSLQVLHPFSTAAANPAALDASTRAAAKAEVERLLAFHPNGKAHNLFAARIELAEASPEKARTRALACLEDFPEAADCHETLGDALLAMGIPGEAAVAFRAALRLEESDSSPTPRLLRRLARCAEDQGDYAGAFRHLESALGGRMPVDAAAEDLHRLALLARRADRPADARRYLRYALLKVRIEDAELRAKIKTELSVPP